jgi:hypothetical protein
MAATAGRVPVMGRNDHDQDDPVILEGTAIEGPVEVYRGTPGDTQDDEEEEGPFNGRKTFRIDIDEDAIAEIIRQRHRGVAIRELAKEHRVSKDTIIRWCGENIDRVKSSTAKAANARAAIVAELRTVRAEAWRIFENNDHPGIKRDMLVRVESTLVNEAILVGAKVPPVVKAEVQVTEVTQADLELQAMIREAQAANARVLGHVEREFKGGP